MKDKVYVVVERGKPIMGMPNIYETLEGAKTELRALKYAYPSLNLEIRSLDFFKKNPPPFQIEGF